MQTFDFGINGVPATVSIDRANIVRVVSTNLDECFSLATLDISSHPTELIGFAKGVYAAHELRKNKKASFSESVDQIIDHGKQLDGELTGDITINVATKTLTYRLLKTVITKHI